MTLKEKVFNYGKGVVMQTYFTLEQKILNAAEDYEVNKLIDKAHSPRRNTRILAKAKLKKFYPNVLEVIENDV